MTAGKIASIAASIVVLAAIAIGLFTLGSPAQERLRRIDEQRIADLSQISSAIARFSERSDRLPTDLSEIVDGQSMRRLPTDPESDANYEYEILEETMYRLCAEFSATSVEGQTDDFWVHSIGRQCFNLEFRGH